MAFRNRGLALAACLAGSLLAFQASAQTPIRIGYAADMSGACGPLVDGATKAFRMGVDDLNKAGGLLGRKIEVIERDTKSQPAEGAKEVRDLIVNHKVDVLTGVCSSAVWLAESAVAAEFKVPLYTAIAATQTGTIEKWHPYTWQTGANTLMESVGAAEYVAASLVTTSGVTPRSRRSPSTSRGCAPTSRSRRWCRSSSVTPT